MNKWIAVGALVLSGSLHASTDPELECLAKNIYFEARNQSETGQLAVGLVTLNRVADKRFPNTICRVVTQGRTWKGFPVRNKCHFSWYCDGLSDRIRNKRAYNQAVRIAKQAIRMHNIGFDITLGSTHYHAKTVSPFWKDTKTYMMTIDDHLFYRW
jgi:spore germination cell wall hydrolase CwlJ-like protein